MEKNEYERVLKKGKRISSQNFSLAMLKNGLGFPRMGHTVAKKAVSQAVSRNKIKRYFRETFRLNKHRFDSNDVVFIAKKDVSHLSFPAVSGEIIDMMGGDK